jgi:hypothetical protein
MPSASSRVRPRETGRMSGTMERETLDWSHAQHCEDPSVVAINRAIQGAINTRRARF